MGVRLMTQKRITGDMLDIATHRDGGRMGLVIPDSDNDGSLRPVFSGSLGSAPTFDGILLSIIGSGDVGTAKFTYQLSVDGSWAQAQGREVISSGSWGTETTIHDNSTYAWGSSSHNPMGGIVQASNRKLIATFSYDDNDGDAYSSIGVCTSPNGGVTWTEVDELLTDASADLTAGKPIRLLNDRLLFTISSGSTVYVKASDDDGSTWSTISTVSGYTHLRAIAELPNGNLIGAYVDSGTSFKSVVSTDGGITWGGDVSIVTPTTLYYGFDLLVLQNGDVLFAYADNASPDLIQAHKSTDGGASWAAATDPLSPTSYDLSDPQLFMDIDGRAYCVATRDNSGDDEIAIGYSDDNGGTWTYSEGTTLASDAGEDVSNPSVCVFDGHSTICICLQTDSGDNLLKAYFSGGWENYNGSTNECPCAIGLDDMYISGSAKVRWEGGAGIALDTYTADVIYDYAAENIVDYDSPGRPWRTATDDISIEDVSVGDVTTDGVELITNGDCELDSDWGSYGTPTTEERSLTQANGGTYSRRFTVDAAEEGTQSGVFTTTTGTPYKISIYIYPDDTTTAHVKVLEGDGVGLIAEENFTSLTQDAWNLCEYAYTETSGGASARIIVTSPVGQTTGTWYVDDLSVKEASPPCYTKWDLTAYDHHSINGVAFFGCNVRTLTFEAHASDSWGSPTIEETVSFDIANGTSSISGSPSSNVIPVSSAWAANHKDHALAGKYFRATAGTDDGVTWKIEDNVGTNIFLDIDAATNLADTDTFAVFGSSAVAFFSAATIRYIRASVPTQETANDCYQIGTMVPFGSSDLAYGWRVGYTRPVTSGVTILDAPSGALYPVISRNSRMEWGLSYPAQDLDGDVLEALKYALGHCMVLVPDDDAGTPTPHLVYLLGDIEQGHTGHTLYDVSITLIEQPSPEVEDYVSMVGGS